MSDRVEDLPRQIQERLLSFLNVRARSTEILDKKGLVDFIVGNGERYLALLALVTVDKEKLMRHIEETGGVPPCVKWLEPGKSPKTSRRFGSFTDRRAFPTKIAKTMDDSRVFGHDDGRIRIE
jgi:hypothetical protein